MAFKLVALFAVVAAIDAAALLPHALIHEPEAPAHYNFQYQVNDPVTGDQKHQEETREGDVVHGSYSLVESDGTRRLVEYTADDVNGFQAVVHKEPLGGVAHVAPIAKVVKPVVHLAPAPVHVAHHVVQSPLATTYPAVHSFPGAYNPNYFGVHPYSGYQPYTGYQSHHLNHYYH